ncbi:MAG: hypothetical protein LIO87_00275 [Eubacterium sp.]|nr:hypothetical protein [Eubacterium sp.]
MPITVKLFEMFNIEPLISEMINTFSSGFYSSSDVINNSLSSLDGFINISRINITGPANTLIQSVSGVFDTTAVNAASLFIMLIIFALCMFICRAVIHIFESAFNKIPLGKTMNMIFGIMCGMIKGFIVV